MVIYEDYATGNIYRFLSNDFTHSYLTIAELYRERWQVECFFKWIKQRLHIKSFYGTSQNAVFSQIWIAICDYLLLAIAKKVYHIDQNLYILSAAIGKVLFERKPLGELFVKPKRPQNDSDDGQLTLWENFFGQQWWHIRNRMQCIRFLLLPIPYVIHTKFKSSLFRGITTKY